MDVVDNYTVCTVIGGKSLSVAKVVQDASFKESIHNEGGVRTDVNWHTILLNFLRRKSLVGLFTLKSSRWSRSVLFAGITTHSMLLPFNIWSTSVVHWPLNTSHISI